MCKFREGAPTVAARRGTNLPSLEDTENSRVERSRWEGMGAVMAHPLQWGMRGASGERPLHWHLMSWALAVSLPLWDLGQITLHC